MHSTACSCSQTHRGSLSKGTVAGAFCLLCNAAVDWLAKLLKVQLSSAEAEVGAGSLGAKRLTYVRQLWGEFKPLAQVPVSFVIDNTAVPALSEHLGVSQKAEHFRRWQLHLRYIVLHGYGFVHICRTWEQLANALTKIENRHAYITFRKVTMNI